MAEQYVVDEPVLNSPMENREEVSEGHQAEVVVDHSILLIVLVHVAAAVPEVTEPVHVLLVLILAADPVPDPDDHIVVVHVTIIPSHRNDHCDDRIVMVVVRHRNVLTANQRAALHLGQEMVEIEMIF